MSPTTKAAILVLALLFGLRRPVRPVAWSLPGPGAYALRAGHSAGWAAVSSTFLISHAGRSGLRQARRHARRIRYSPPPFTKRGAYARIRHLLMAGFVAVFWPAPAMTAGTCYSRAPRPATSWLASHSKNTT